MAPSTPTSTWQPVLGCLCCQLGPPVLLTPSLLLPTAPPWPHLCPIFMPQLVAMSSRWQVLKAPPQGPPADLVYSAPQRHPPSTPAP